MRYFDTSFRVPLVLPEAASEPIASFFENLAGETLSLSDWTRLEFASLLSRAVRKGGLGRASELRAESQFEAMLRELLVVLVPNRDYFDRARHWLGRFDAGLSAGDASHLSTVENREETCSTRWTSR